MTIKHYIKLIPAKFGWFRRKVLQIKTAYRLIQTITILQKLRPMLENKRLSLSRRNNENTAKEAYGVQCQVELIDFLLGERKRL